MESNILVLQQNGIYYCIRNFGRRLIAISFLIDKYRIEQYWLPLSEKHKDLLCEELNSCFLIFSVRFSLRLPEIIEGMNVV